MDVRAELDSAVTVGVAEGAPRVPPHLNLALFCCTPMGCNERYRRILRYRGAHASPICAFRTRGLESARNAKKISTASMIRCQLSRLNVIVPWLALEHNSRMVDDLKTLGEQLGVADRICWQHGYCP